MITNDELNMYFYIEDVIVHLFSGFFLVTHLILSLKFSQNIITNGSDVALC